MTKLEKREEIIKGLEKVWDAFNHMEHELYADYVYDALTLLKAQQLSNQDRIDLDVIHRIRSAKRLRSQSMIISL